MHIILMTQIPQSDPPSQLNQLGSKAASDSTLKQLTLAGYQILVLYLHNAQVTTVSYIIQITTILDIETISLHCRLSVHLLKTDTVVAACRLPFTRLHHMYTPASYVNHSTHLLQLVHIIELSATLSPHTSPHKSQIPQLCLSLHHFSSKH